MSHWLHKEGNWHLLSRNQCEGEVDGSEYNSFIWHSCPKATTNYGGCWRWNMDNLNIPCGLCGDAVPEGIQTVWTLHNMDIKGP